MPHVRSKNASLKIAHSLPKSISVSTIKSKNQLLNAYINRESHKSIRLTKLGRTTNMRGQGKSAHFSLSCLESVPKLRKLL